MMPSLFEKLIDIGEAAAKRIDQPHFASIFLTKIAGRCIAESLNTRAVKLLSDAQDRANSIEVEFLRTLSLIRIVDAYLLLGMESEALTVARRALNSARSVEGQLLNA